MPARNANTLRTMDAEEYRETIAELGLDQIQAGNVLGVSHRMSRYYIAGHTAIPDEAATILRFMRKFKVPASDLIAINEETKGNMFVTMLKLMAAWDVSARKVLNL